MTSPTNPTARLWRNTWSDQRIPLVDAVLLCNLKVRHPLILRATQRPIKCYPVCSHSGNLRVLANNLVTLVARNKNYINIIKWICPTCTTHNIGSTSCSTCPPDPFKNSPLLTLLGKCVDSFFKAMVLLIGTNPPTNFAPETVTNYRLIETILTSHGIKWGRLLPFDHNFHYKCSCIKHPQISTIDDNPLIPSLH